jgi:hypothetical protein
VKILVVAEVRPVSRTDWILIAATLIATSIGWFIGGMKAAVACLAAGVLIEIVLPFTRSKEKTPENFGTKDSFNPAVAHKPEEIIKSNLVLRGVYLGTLYLIGDIWSKNVPAALTRPVRKYQAIFAEIKNAGKQGEAVGPVKAELLISNEEFMPLPWLDQNLNSVNFQFGDVKYVLLAVGMETHVPALGDWRIVLNRRDDQTLGPGVSAMDFDRRLKRVSVVSGVKTKLNLLHVKNGQILTSFEGTCRWTEGFGIPNIFFRPL